MFGPVAARIRRSSALARRQLVVAVGGPARTRVVVLLACVLALASADTATVGASAVELRRALHIDNTDIGLLISVSSLVAAVFSLPLGAMADRARRTWLLAFALLTWGGVMLWSAAAASFGQLLLSRLALGAVTAASGPVVASLVGDWFPAHERSRIYGFILTGELLGAGAGFAITGDIAALSWRAAFVILALPAFILCWLFFRLPEPARGGQDALSVEHGSDEVPDVMPDGSGPAGPARPGGAGRGNGPGGNGPGGNGPGAGTAGVPPAADDVRTGGPLRDVGPDQCRADHLQRMRLLLPGRDSGVRHGVRLRAVPRGPGPGEPAAARGGSRRRRRCPGRRPDRRHAAAPGPPERPHHDRCGRGHCHGGALHSGADDAQRADSHPLRGRGSGLPVRAEPAYRLRPPGHHAAMALGPGGGSAHLPAHGRAGASAGAVRGVLRQPVRRRHVRAEVGVRDHAPAAGGLGFLPVPRPAVLPVRRCCHGGAERAGRSPCGRSRRLTVPSRRRGGHPPGARGRPPGTGGCRLVRPLSGPA